MDRWAKAPYCDAHYIHRRDKGRCRHASPTPPPRRRGRAHHRRHAPPARPQPRRIRSPGRRLAVVPSAGRHQVTLAGRAGGRRRCRCGAAGRSGCTPPNGTSAARQRRDHHGRRDAAGLRPREAACRLRGRPASPHRASYLYYAPPLSRRPVTPRVGHRFSPGGQCGCPFPPDPSCRSRRQREDRCRQCPPPRSVLPRRRGNRLRRRRQPYLSTGDDTNPFASDGTPRLHQRQPNRATTPSALGHTTTCAADLGSSERGRATRSRAGTLAPAPPAPRGDRAMGFATRPDGVTMPTAGLVGDRPAPLPISSRPSAGRVQPTPPRHYGWPTQRHHTAARRTTIVPSGRPGEFTCAAPQNTSRHNTG